MYMYPRLIVNLSQLRENAAHMKALCAEHGIGITNVTKVFAGEAEIVQALVDGGAERLGDSRIANIRKYSHIQAEKWLIRPPMLSEVQELVRYADASLNSEMEVVRAISDEVIRQGRPRHKVILMADLGDIREGYVDADELIAAAAETERLEGVEIYGVGVNLTCFSFIKYDEEKMAELADIRARVEKAVGHSLCVASGGNSATVALMLDGGIPEGVNNLRLGESVLFGKERANYSYLPGMHRDCFIMEAEIVELKTKPSLPWGTVGADSYGNIPEFTDRGDKRVKAICALGKQDFDPDICTLQDPGIIMLGASSDHLMLDVTDSETEYKVGDVIRLELGYFSTMRAFTSSYVEKIYVDR